MLPFDNKSEFQVVDDAGRHAGRETARVLREIGAELAQVPEVTDVVPGLRRHGQPDQLQRPGAPVLPARPCRDGRHPGQPGGQAAPPRGRATRSRWSVRERIVAIGKKNGGNAKVVEVPPGPPVMSPIVAEVYGPDYAGQMAVGKGARGLRADRHRRHRRQHRGGRARKLVLHVLQARRRNSAWRRATSSRWSAWAGRHGCDAGARNTESEIRDSGARGFAGRKANHARCPC